LLEALRAGTAPAAILTTGVETFFALAAIVADEVFQQTLPVIVIDEHEAATLHTGMNLRVERDGTIVVEATPAE
jgi:predicted aconitase with swiveling domain